MNFIRSLLRLERKFSPQLLQGEDMDWEPNLSLWDYLCIQTKSFESLPAQVDVETGEVISFKTVMDKACLLSEILEDRGISEGDVVAICSENNIQYCWVLVGCNKAKAACLLLNHTYSPRELEHALSITRPKLVICSKNVAKYEFPNGDTAVDVFLRMETVQDVMVWGCSEVDQVSAKFTNLDSLLPLHCDCVHQPELKDLIDHKDKHAECPHKCPDAASGLEKDVHSESCVFDKKHIDKETEGTSALQKDVDSELICIYDKRYVDKETETLSEVSKQSTKETVGEVDRKTSIDAKLGTTKGDGIQVEIEAGVVTNKNLPCEAKDSNFSDIEAINKGNAESIAEVCKDTDARVDGKSSIDASDNMTAGKDDGIKGEIDAGAECAQKPSNEAEVKKEEIQELTKEELEARIGDRIALILSSSGSTGLPKGVMITNSNLMAALHTSGDFMMHEGCNLGLMPFYHAYGLTLMLMSLRIGCQLAVMSKFNVELFLKSVPKYKMTNLYLVPSLLAVLSKHDISGEDWSSLRAVWTGAALVGPKLQEQMKKRFGPKVVLHHSYGLTETTFVVLHTKYSSEKQGSPGCIVPCMKVKLIDPDTLEDISGPNKTGELCFQGPLIMKGYMGNPEETQKVIDSEGWLRTGDLGSYDGDGFFTIVDRLKELIKYQGHQVSPSELESILLTHPAVQDAAVIGLPDEVYGELPHALIVKQPEISSTPKEIEDFIASEVSPHKRLHGGVRFVESIPKTANGKIHRKVLKAMIAEETKTG